MSTAEMELIAMVVSMFGLGTFTLIGLKMFLGYRAKRIQGANPEELKRLTDALEGMQDQIVVMRDDMNELHERVDFAERLLAKSRHEEPKLP